VEFVEAPFFTQFLPDYLSDDDYRALQHSLARDPEAGDIIPGTGGFRKLRWADQIWLMTLHDKDEVADLSPNERRLLKAAIEQETRQRAERRRTRRK